MKYRLEESKLQLMRAIFSQTPAIEQVVLYGSKAKGTHKPFSDVDITLKGSALTDEDLTDVMYRLSESSLPYFYDVSPFRNIGNPDLKDHIIRKGKSIYERAMTNKQ